MINIFVIYDNVTSGFRNILPCNFVLAETPSPTR